MEDPSLRSQATVRPRGGRWASPTSLPTIPEVYLDDAEYEQCYAQPGAINGGIFFGPEEIDLRRGIQAPSKTNAQASMFVKDGPLLYAIDVNDTASIAAFEAVKAQGNRKALVEFMSASHDQVRTVTI